MKWHPSLEIATYDGCSTRMRYAASSAMATGLHAGMEETLPLDLPDSQWLLQFHLQPADPDSSLDGFATFRTVSGGEMQAGVALRIDFPDWSTDNYVMLPAAVYGGNRFRCVPKPYPPFLHAEDGIGPDMATTITDVPRLADGTGPSRIHLRSGDMATPCVGLFNPHTASCFLLFGEPGGPDGYTGWFLEESADRTHAVLRLESPAVRETVYRMGNTTVASDDHGAAFAAGDSATLRFRIVSGACADIDGLFRMFCLHRSCMAGTPEPVHGLPFKFLGHQWNDRFGYILTTPDSYGTPFGDWQAGWCGGGMHTLAFLSDGTALSRERSRMTIDAMFGVLQRPDGWIHPIFSAGIPLGDDFCHQQDTRILLIRKNADLLLFAGRHIALMRTRAEMVPDGWMAGYRRLADAFVRLWRKNGQFGQFIDMDTDGILQGGTASGAIASGGLALAWQLIGEAAYLEVGIASADAYLRTCLDKGVLNGGPGEILQNADSESAFGLLESLVELYEATGDRRWLAHAEACGRQCASWCMSYDFPFPPGSVFGRLDMRTTGSVFANAQNKHSAPAICTLSGVSLLKLFRATGNRYWLDLLRDIAHNVTQYLSREDRPIQTWEESGMTTTESGIPAANRLQPGFMCERVNTSDWESKACIGAVFNGSCWCETSTLLTWTEVPGIWLNTDTGDIAVLDHVDVTVTRAENGWRLAIHNPTPFEAQVKLLAETTRACEKPLGPNPLEESLQLRIPAGTTLLHTVMSTQEGGAA